ncbi:MULTISPECIES: AraC family transcriptional regulator [Paenibacillus]|uniref:AraC family transcriptional regulator n=1 Tax=Paenibacillus TaxID=44249 RepID=UPI002FE0FCE4
MKSRIIFGKTEETSRLPIFMTTLGYWEHQNETHRPAGFPDYQVHQVIQGQGKLVLGEEEFLVGPGEVFFLFPDIPHRYMPVSERWELAWVSFQGREASQLLAYAGVNGSGVGRLRTRTLMDGLQRMLEAEEHGDENFETECSKQLYNLLLDLNRELIAAEAKNDELERMRPVLTYIAHNLPRPLPLGELAEIAGVSPQYLCRLFQKTLKLRPLAYINQERVNLSKKLMFTERDKRIYEIAQKVGYENSSYFCAVFKRHTGMSPEEFKKMHGLGS